MSGKSEKMIFYDEKRKRKFYFRLIQAGLVFGLIFSIFDLGQSLAGTYFQETNYDHSYYFENWGSNKLALTFDDGPDPRWTPQIANILIEKQVPATFFLLGENVIKHKALARWLHEAGFELGNHTFTHSDNVHSSERRLAMELNATNKLIEEITGHSAILYRPPYLMNVGNDPLFLPDYPEPALAWAEKHGYIAVGADIDAKDWLAESPQDIKDKIYSSLDQGHIILLHDGAYDQSHTIAALPEIIDTLRSEGYEFVAVSELLGLERSQVMPGLSENKDGFRRILDSFYYNSLSAGSRAFFIAIWLIMTLIILRLGLILLLLAASAAFGSRSKTNKSSFAQSASVLIPAYNEEKSIAATIASVMANEGPIREVIVINDGSTDKTADIVREMIGLYPGKLRLIDQPNGGKAAALNNGLSAAQSEIVVAMDGDTVFAPDAIGKLIRNFDDPLVGAVAGKVQAIRPGSTIGAFQAIEYIIGQNIDKRALAAINAIGVVPGPVGAWRRDLVLRLGGYSTDTLVEDQDLTLAILEQGYRIRYEPLAIAYTETPDTVRNFVKQRFRWIFGTMQCFWKYKRNFLSVERPNLGWVVMPNILLYNTLVPLFSPLIDLMALIAIWQGNWLAVLIAYNVFTAFDIMYASLAFVGEKKSRHLLLMIPLQRLYYRQLFFFVIVKSLVRAIEGTGALWNKVERRGQVKRFYAAIVQAK